MSHKCSITQEKTGLSCIERVRKRFRELITISQSNPRHFHYFKSHKTIEKEQKRHRKINPYVIHPFSPFRGVYEVFLMVVYTSALISKPMVAFLYVDRYTDTLIFKKMIITVDLLCWLDIAMTFFSGFIKESQHMYIIELRIRAIAKNYLLSHYFICDVLSSLPVGRFYYSLVLGVEEESAWLFFTANFLVLFKIVRIVPLFTYIYNSATYCRFVSTSVPFFTCVSLMFLLTVHWSACLQYFVPRATGLFYPWIMNKTWIHRDGIEKKNFLSRYNHAFYKTSAYILAIRQNTYKTETNAEYLLGVLTYFVGKILVAFVWLILAIGILNSRSVHIKFVEVMNQLGEYTKRKKLPPNLSDRLSQYYNYKYQKKYFQEGLFQSFLSDNLKRDIRLHVCRTMIKSVSIFSGLSHKQLGSMIDCLIPEIFLPEDTIIHHGTVGDAMYFLFSGTVAVYTPSGREICHLQDGAYFGEISLILPNQNRNASVVAVEISHIYRLSKRHFDQWLAKNVNVMQKIMKEAEERLCEATKVEQEYQEYLFEQTFQQVT